MPVTGQKRDRRSGDCRGSRGRLVLAGVLLMSAFWPMSRADARLLNLTGDTTLEYRLNDVDSDSGHSSLDNLREIVRVGTSGELFREAIGQYSLNMSFTNDDLWTNLANSGSSEANRQDLDFFATIGLFPRVMPLSLTGQRTTQTFDASNGGAPGALSASSETTITTLSLTGVLPRIWKLPQLQVNLYYSVIETDSCTLTSPLPCHNKDKIFGGSVNAADQYPYRYLIKNTELNWTIAFSSTERFNGGGGGLNVSGRVTADSTWTPALKTNLRASVTTGISRQTSNVPGGVPTSTGAGATLFYRPSLRLNSAFGYDYTKDIYDRHTASADALYRPGPQFDVTTTLRSTYLDLKQSQIISGFGNLLVTYRPILNLTTIITSTLGATHTAADSPGSAGESTVVFQNYGVSANYFKLYDLVRVATGAGLGVGIANGGGANSTTYSSNWMAEVSNINRQYVSAIGAYSGFINQSSGGGTDQLINTISADASSSYFRELLLRGDALALHLGMSDRLTAGNSDNHQNIDIGFDTHYGWRAVGLGSGYAMHLTTQADEDYDEYFVELHWTVPPLLPAMTLLLHGRYEEQMFKGGVGTDRSTALADATGSYQIGLVQFSLQYLFNYQDSGSTTLSHNLYLRLTRRFSL